MATSRPSGLLSPTTLAMVSLHPWRLAGSKQVYEIESGFLRRLHDRKDSECTRLLYDGPNFSKTSHDVATLQRRKQRALAHLRRQFNWGCKQSGGLPIFECLDDEARPRFSILTSPLVDGGPRGGR